MSGLTGFLPLMLASGAGAQSQSSLGLGVFSGLLVATFSQPWWCRCFSGYEVVAGQADAEPQDEVSTLTTQQG